MAKRSEDQKATASPKKKPKKAPLSDAEKYVHPTPIERQAVDAENTFSMVSDTRCAITPQTHNKALSSVVVAQNSRRLTPHTLSLSLSVSSRNLQAYWNMGGIRSSLQKRPELFERLLETTNRPEVIVLAEHKLQPVEKDVKAVEKDLAAIFPGYRCIWNCSVRKGYSGVVALVREEVLSLKPAALSNMTVEVETPPENSKKYQILSCHRGLGIPPIQSDYNTEGRVLTLNFSRPNFYLVVSYVPNSGAGLKRLDYRIGTWESDCREYLKKLSEEKPVAYIGDMNVAHLDLGESNERTSERVMNDDRELSVS